MVRAEKCNQKGLSGRLLAINPPDLGSSEFLLLGELVWIGNDESNDCVIRDGTVSQRHAAIQCRSGSYELTDLGSTNGTFVNGERVKGWVRLQKGDNIRLGAARFVFSNLDRAIESTSSIRSEQGTPRRRLLFIRTLVELMLIAFVVGFGGAPYLAYLMYSQENRLILAKAVPLPPPPAALSTNALPLERSGPTPPSPTSERTAPAHAPAGPTAPKPAPAAESNPSDAANSGTSANSGSADEPRRELASAVALTSLFSDSGKHAGETAANLRLQDLAGNWVSLDSLRGKVVLLNTWATWCGACRSEMPSLNQLYSDFSRYPSFALLTVSLDQQTDKVAPFLERNGYHFPVLLDPNNQAGQSYDLRGIPATFLIGRDGHILWSVAGGIDWSSPEIHRAIQNML
jgi:peroxiredoxin